MVRGKLSASIDPELLKKLDIHCEEHSKNRSKLLEKLIKEYLQEKRK